jgi:hypothetical protein
VQARNIIERLLDYADASEMRAYVPYIVTLCLSTPFSAFSALIAADHRYDPAVRYLFQAAIFSFYLCNQGMNVLDALGRLCEQQCLDTDQTACLHPNFHIMRQVLACLLQFKYKSRIFA